MLSLIELLHSFFPELVIGFLLIQTLMKTRRDIYIIQLTDQLTILSDILSGLPECECEECQNDKS